MAVPDSGQEMRRESTRRAMHAAIASVRRFLLSPLNILILAGLAVLIWRYGGPVLHWLIIDAQWHGTTNADCKGDGACWVFIRVHLGQILFGFYPEEERWRVLTGFGVPAIVAALLFIPRLPFRHRLAYGLILLGPVFALALLSGGFAGLPLVPTSRWGGLMVTLVVGFIGVILSLPLGTLLAMGRQSSMPLVRVICVAYIEVWRGVPILGVLFVTTLLIALTLPPEVVISRFTAAMIGIVLYAAAFMAEVIRGGLQGVQSLQFEAADALGFTYWRRMQSIILPQAFRNVLPGLVNTFINLFKSSALVFVVGIFDLLGIIQNAARNAAWAGRFAEGYIFTALIFFVICFCISRYSRRLEKRIDPMRRTQLVLE